MFKLFVPITIVVILCAQIALGQSADWPVTPQRSCPPAQPYCNNHWEVIGANGERYWMVRWARKFGSDIVTLRFPLDFIDPIARIDCSISGKEFPQPSCQQPFAVSFLLRATYPGLQSLLRSSAIPPQNSDDRISILITSPAGGTNERNLEEIFMGSIEIFSRIGERKKYPRTYKENIFNLTKIGVSRNISGKEAIGLRDIYYDGRDLLRSRNLISCTYDNSPIAIHRCTQTFMIKKFNSIASVSYEFDHLHQWETINYLVNESIEAAAAEG